MNAKNRNGLITAAVLLIAVALTAQQCDLSSFLQQGQQFITIPLDSTGSGSTQVKFIYNDTFSPGVYNLVGVDESGMAALKDVLFDDVNNPSGITQLQLRNQCYAWGTGTSYPFRTGVAYQVKIAMENDKYIIEVAPKDDLGNPIISASTNVSELGGGGNYLHIGDPFDDYLKGSFRFGNFRLNGEDMASDDIQVIDTSSEKSISRYIPDFVTMERMLIINNRDMLIDVLLPSGITESVTVTSLVPINGTFEDYLGPGCIGYDIKTVGNTRQITPGPSIGCNASAVVEICDDGLDNDGDGSIDCTDPNCAGNAACP